MIQESHIRLRTSHGEIVFDIDSDVHQPTQSTGHRSRNDDAFTIACLSSSIDRYSRYGTLIFRDKRHAMSAAGYHWSCS